MPVQDIVKGIRYPEWVGARFKRLDKFQRFLDGTIYDHIPNPFYYEREPGTQAYIPLRERRPSVIYNLCRVVVDRSTRLLFGGKHFPKFQSSDQSIVKFLNTLSEKSELQTALLEAAYIGSIGSVGVFFCIRKNKIFYEVRNPRFCMPFYDEDKELEKARIMYPVLGSDLFSCGFAIKEEDLDEEFFYIKEFTKMEEVIYHPVKVVDYNLETILRRDEDKTTRHELGFVPGVWIKNLWPMDGIDGACTFDQILNFSVEIDYQLSQCGRGLKYNSDPQLLIKEPGGNTDEASPTVRSTATAIYVGEEGDAKLLEISGQGQKAVLEYVKLIRQYAFDTVSSSRKDPESSYGNMSGRAMEILEGDLIALASALRLTYGEHGLKPLLIKIIKAATKYKLFGANDPTDDKDFNLELQWGNWFDPTPTDLSQTETALDLAVKGRRLWEAEARMISASIWGVGNTDPKKLAEEWIIPPTPQVVEDEMKAAKDLAETKRTASGTSGRGTQGSTAS